MIAVTDFGIYRVANKLTAMLPKFTGMSVLDIGGYDGIMAKTALNRGAASAVVVDNQQYKQYEDYAVKPMPEGVLLFADDVFAYHTPADVVLCYDVLYHIKEPYSFLEHLHFLTLRTLCLSTRIIPGEDTVWRLYAPREGHHNDPTVFWKPTLNGLHKAMEMVGFKGRTVTFYEAPGVYEEDGLVVEQWTHDTNVSPLT